MDCSMNSSHHEALNILINLHGDFVKAAKPALNSAYTPYGSYQLQETLPPVIEIQQAINLMNLCRTGEAAEIISEYAEKFEQKAAKSLTKSQMKASFLSGISKRMVAEAKASAEYEGHVAGQLRRVLTLIR